jgi:hypothetical protein
MTSRDLAAAAGGAALAAVVAVTVYEGKVGLVRDNQSRVLDVPHAGELDADGAQPNDERALGAAAEQALLAHREGSAAAGIRTLVPRIDAPGGSVRRLEHRAVRSEGSRTWSVRSRTSKRNSGF